MTVLPHGPLVGYLEGYYGRLLSTSERRDLLRALSRHHLNCWWYAPKDDAQHRLHWREPYAASWRRDFRDFCARADDAGVRVMAGLAPGLDFDFASLPDGPDLDRLIDKTRALLDDGATIATLLLDDIDDDFEQRRGAFDAEGVAHASLANALGDALDSALVVVPRIYANELHDSAPSYLPDFARTLDARHAIALCGSDVVARRVSEADCRRHLGDTAHRIVVWDNLYANDYCPRRLFVGPWTGREGLVDVLLNPTGLPATDALLLDLMASERERHAQGEGDARSLWREVLNDHGVPSCFAAVASHFDSPVCNSDLSAPASSMAAPIEPASAHDEDTLEAALRSLDELTWRWKSPLAREWFPWLMGLRHDLLLEAGRLPDDRLAKTQSVALARAWRARGSGHGTRRDQGSRSS